MSISPLSPPTRFDNFANTPSWNHLATKTERSLSHGVPGSDGRRPCRPGLAAVAPSPVSQGRRRRPVGAAAHDSGLGIRDCPSRPLALSSSPRPPAKYIIADLQEPPAKDCGADLLEPPPRSLYLVECLDLQEQQPNLFGYFTPGWCLMKCARGTSFLG
jgi:hypothetical protein